MEEIFRRTGCPKRTIFRIKKLVMSGKSIKHKKGAGPPTVTSISHKQSLIRTLETFPKMSIRKFRSNLAYKYQEVPSNSTVFRFIQKAGFSCKKLSQVYLLLMK